MSVEIVTREDLEKFRNDIIQEVRGSIEKVTASSARPDEYLSSADVIEILGVSDKQFAKYRQQRRITFSQIGRKIYVKRSDLEKFLDQYRIEARK